MLKVREKLPRRMEIIGADGPPSIMTRECVLQKMIVSSCPVYLLFPAGCNTKILYVVTLWNYGLELMYIYDVTSCAKG